MKIQAKPPPSGTTQAQGSKAIRAMKSKHNRRMTASVFGHCGAMLWGFIAGYDSLFWGLVLNKLDLCAYNSLGRSGTSALEYARAARCLIRRSAGNFG
jgi:hypothetical protein